MANWGKRSIADLISSLDEDEKASSKRIDNNTIEYYREDGTKVIRLHDTDIIEFMPDGGIKLNSGGWQTPTTKNRIERFSPVQIYQRKGEWFFSSGNEEVHFFDGIIVDRNGKVKNAKKGERAIKRKARLMSQIDAYCNKIKRLMKKNELPKPSGGDCWDCAMKDKDGNTMADMSGDTSHLKLHLRQKYVHGSLIMNAIEYAGYNQGYYYHLIYEEGEQSCYLDVVIKAVKKYFTHKLMTT